MDARNASINAGTDLAPEFIMTRVFDAPAAVVFDAWTKPERLVRWWGGKTFTIPFCEMDFRPGGSFRMACGPPLAVIIGFKESIAKSSRRKGS